MNPAHFLKSEKEFLLSFLFHHVAVYGDKIRFVCQAVPSEMTRAALPNTVDFYCDDVLLGTASVDSKGQAVFVYNTAEQKNFWFY